jgi:H+/gluconate symporter-like permease
LIYFAYRGWSVIYIAPIAAMIATLGSSISPLPAYTEIFMSKGVVFIAKYLPIFVLSAIFGEVLTRTGMIQSIAAAIVRFAGTRRVMLSVLLAGMILTYGGVNVAPAAFTLYPLARALYLKADIPKKLLPANMLLALTGATFDAYPGSPQPGNLIPSSYFGTDTYAAPWLGLIAGTAVYVIGMAWLERRRKKASLAGEGYGQLHTNEDAVDVSTPALPWMLSIIPLLAVVVLNFVFTRLVNWDARLLDAVVALKIPLAASSVRAATANWAIIVALAIGIALTLLIGRKRLGKGQLQAAFNLGAIGCLVGIVSVACEVGYGNLIGVLPGFQMVAHDLLNVRLGQTPLGNIFFTTNVLAGLAGSSSAGLIVSLDLMSKSWLAWANMIGMSPELLHRVAAMSAGGFDTLPHNGTVIMILLVCGLTHKQSYPDMFAITLSRVAGGFIAAVLGIAGFHLGLF